MRSDKHQEAAKSSGNFEWLLRGVCVQRRLIATGALYMTMAAGAAIVDPLLMRALIDKALPQRSLTLALEYAAGISLCFICRAVFYSLDSLNNLRLSQAFAFTLRTRILTHMTGLPRSYHEETPTGEKVARVQEDVEEIASVGGDTIGQSLRAASLLSINLLMMMRLSSVSTLFIMPVLFVFGVLHQRFRPVLRIRAATTRDQCGASVACLTEHLASVPQIQLLTAEGLRVERAMAAIQGLFAAQTQERIVEVMFGGAIQLALICTMVGSLVLCSRQVLEGRLTAGSLIAFYTYTARVFDPIGTVIDLYSRLQGVRASIGRVRQVLEHNPLPGQGGLSLQGKPARGLVMEDVSFSYGHTPVLNRISMEVQVDERVALVGPSGAGKSTIGQLFVRSIDPRSGVIKLNDVVLSDYTLRSLRQAVCYVPQRPILFHDTIRRNLTMAAPQVSAARLDEVVYICDLEKIFRRLPHGLDAQLTPDAACLSGGERQRLAISRALLRQADFLLLDEATSALDVPSERQLFTRLRASPIVHGVVIISHRLITLEWVDRIILVSDGELVGTGRHTDLDRTLSLYRELYHRPAEGAPFVEAEI